MKRTGITTLGVAIVVLGLAAILANGCGRSATRVSGGGATFINPMMQKWSDEYKTKTGVEIDYVSKGSSYGIEQTTDKNIDFGCSDAPLKKDQVEKAKAKGGEIVHVPMIMGAVAIVYNVPECKEPLKLTGSVLAEIYRREVTKWNDKKIAELNPGVNLPEKDIVAVARAEGSGTSNVFSEYLSKSNEGFKSAIGTSTKPKWPQGVVAQEQNDGVAGFVKNNAYTIGYVEVLFAKKNELATAKLKNKAGEFLGPDAEGVTSAATEAMKTKPTEEPYSLHDLTFSLTDADGAKSYPICGISYAIFYSKLPKGKGEAAIEFLKWAATDGQAFAKDLDYAPLPDDLRKKAVERLGQVTFE